MVPDDLPPPSADPLRLPSWLGGRMSETVLVPMLQPAPPSPEMMQEEFPQLHVEEMIGRGGMGVVYKGRDAVTGLPVAIKVLPEELRAASPEFLERFEQEAKVMQRLQHPHVVNLQQLGTTASGLPFLLMEFVDGEDLGQRLRREGRLPWAVALPIALQLCEALKYAHQMGVIHRDIKPSNILLTATGTVKVADFGLARLVDNSVGSEQLKVSVHGMTQGFHLMGSLDYQAPETLILGAAVDERADLYAVGVTIYQMLMGTVPRGIFHLPSKLINGLDPRIDIVISNLLQQNPYERTASAHDLVLALREILKGPRAEPTKPKPRARRWWSWR
jgi:serine/threonine protein kinase